MAQKMSQMYQLSILCPVMIKVVISAAGFCASRSCSAFGFCFLVSSARKAM